MYILYICVIIVFCAALIGLYFFFAKRDKKRYDTLQNAKEKVEKQEQNDTEIYAVKSEKEIEEEAMKEKQDQTDFEDYVWSDDQNEKSPAQRSSFDFSDEDDETDKKFSSYEEFLRKNLGDLNFDDDDEDEETKEEDEREDYAFNEKSMDFSNDHHHTSRPKTSFSLDDFKGKSLSEIHKMIEHLPPRVQEIMLEDILKRRKFDDENDENDKGNFDENADE